MSRVSRRAGTKSLVCTRCGNKSGRNLMSFRGKGKARLEKHMREVHNV